MTSRRGDSDDSGGKAFVGDARTPLSVGVLAGLELGDDGCLDGVVAVLGSSSSSLSVTTLMVPSLDTNDDVWLIIDARFASLRRNCWTALMRATDVDEVPGTPPASAGESAMLLSDV